MIYEIRNRNENNRDTMIRNKDRKKKKNKKKGKIQNGIYERVFEIW